jgi:hypothetical protein
MEIREISVILKFENRRTHQTLANVVDDALELAAECGWRYALAYLISEGVSSQIIQRLLSGGRARRTAEKQPAAFLVQDYGWKGRNVEEMVRLFDALRKRRSVEPCTANRPPLACRSCAPPTDKT